MVRPLSPKKTARGKVRQRAAFGSIDLRGPGQYRARVRVNGKALLRTFRSEQAAKDWVGSLELLYVRPERREALSGVATLTLERALRARLTFIESNKNIANERTFVERMCRNFPSLCAMSPFKIDEADIQLFIRQRQDQGVGPGTINRELSVLSHTFNLARARLLCIGLRNPVGKALRLKLPPGRERRLAQDEDAALMQAAVEVEATSACPIRAVIRFACNTAMRMGEIARMDWEHVDLVKGTVHVPFSKNGRHRTVPLWKEVRVLLAGLNPKTKGPVWGEYWALRAAWVRTRDRAIATAVSSGQQGLAERLKDLTFKDFRHEGTSRFAERTGWENAKLKAVTGHQTDAMLHRYTHIRSSKLAAELLEIEGVSDDEASTVPTDEEFGPLPVSPLAMKQRAAWSIIRDNVAMLGALIQAKPLRDVAADFGVSDVAVHKACAKHGLEKPGRGYWLKAGHRPSVLSPSLSP